MGGSGGVNRFDPNTGRFTVYAHKLGDPKSLSSDLVTSVYVDHSGTIWVSTQNGLNKLSENGTFTNYFVKDGLPSNNVSCILEDQSGMLWMSTNRGLSRFDPIAKKFTNYSTVDGLPGNDLTGWDACFKSPSGEMFFGGFSGGVAFFPDKVQDKSSPPLLVMTDFRLAGKSVRCSNCLSLVITTRSEPSIELQPPSARSFFLLALLFGLFGVSYFFSLVAFRETNNRLAAQSAEMTR
jgi:streptogramin lyase